MMRRIFQLSMICLIAGAASACNSAEKIIATEDIPTAGVRLINAVPDTAGAYGFDLRFVDMVENSTSFRITFRNTPTTTAGIAGMGGAEYKPARAGSRHFVIFFDDSIQAIASKIVKDTTVNLTAGKNYTALLWGSARAGTMKLTFIEEAVPDPGTQVALRIINATTSAIDATQYLKGAAVPATNTWSNVAAMSVSSYVTTAPGAIMYNVRAAGSATALFTDVQALLGSPASSSAGTSVLDLAPIPGTSVAGSALTMVVFPATTPGSRAANFAAVGGAFMWDRRPPGVPGT